MSRSLLKRGSDWRGQALGGAGQRGCTAICTCRSGIPFLRRPRFPKTTTSIDVLISFGNEDQQGKGTANNAKNANEAGISGLSKLVVGRALIVADTLGSGFIEKACAHALACEPQQRGLAVVQQSGVIVRYDAAIVGEYTTDLPVENAVLVEPTAVTTPDAIHFVECLNCREATGVRSYLLLKFGTLRAEIDVPFRTFEAPDLFAFICG